MSAGGAVAGPVGQQAWLGRPASSRSWIDWVLDQLDRIPGPRWATYLAITVALGVTGEVVRWQDGSLPANEVSLVHFVEGSFLPLFLLAMRELDGVALRALDRIRPALPLAPAEAEAVGHVLTRTPATWALLSAVIAPIFGIASVLGEPGSYQLGPANSAATWAFAYLGSILSALGALLFTAHGVAQLRMVARIHRIVNVDIFRLQPLYAFSSLTSRTGISLVAILVFGFVTVYALNGSFTTFAATDLAIIAVLAGLAVACFVVPLLGLHDRIDAEKGRRLAAAQTTVERALTEVQARIGNGDFERAKDLNDGLAAARAAAATIAAVSTWPWRPETLRAFLSVLVAPVILWLTTAFLAQAIGR